MIRRDETGCCTVYDRWAPYRGKYPDPTPLEFLLIQNYLLRFDWEYDDFDEHKSLKWISIKNRLQCPNPNLLDQLIQLVRQVRLSKGYDVDLYLDVLSPYCNVFIPRRLDDMKFYDEAMAAAKVAIGEINTHTMMAYKVVSVDKIVSSSYKTYNKIGEVPPIIITNVLLLTFTAKAAAMEEDTSFQAMLVVCDQPPPTFLLKEWKFKPL